MNKKQIVGWREWLKLPDLNIPAIKAKVDSGARTSCLHALDIERIKHEGQDMVEFKIQPLQRNSTLLIPARAPLVDIRKITDSGGHTETRFVIATQMSLGRLEKSIDITLTQRPSMMFRMLLGRMAMSEDMLIDPSVSFACGRLPSRLLYADKL